MPHIVPRKSHKTHGENQFRSLREGDSPRCGEMSAKQTKGTAPSALSSDSETEGVGVFFTPSVKTCGFATSLYEGGECMGRYFIVPQKFRKINGATRRRTLQSTPFF